MKHMKHQTIKLFEQFLTRMEKGYIDDYQNILNRIAFLQTHRQFKSYQKILEYLKNHE